MKVIESFSLENKVAVMTGGAGLYGRQIAEALAEAGAKTFMASRNLEKLEAQARTFRDAGLDVTALRYDQAEETSIRELLQQVVDAAGGVDILVNNSVARPMTDWSDTEDAWAESMRVNATGLFSMTRVFGDYMADRGGGNIINIGSMYGMVGPDYTMYEGLGWGCSPDYFFHKAGMILLTRFVASKLGPQGVRCNAISPGGFFNNQDPVFLERYNKRNFLGRMANESDLKGVIVFLASDASAYVTGTNIPIDGGYTAK
jgi:NAD(P)-dependent dehydrogenase (short-subunit alcohol dehydrogenase family)